MLYPSFRQIFTTLLLLVMSLHSYGFPGDPGGDPDGIPVDKGISWLAMAGLIYGFVKIKKAIGNNNSDKNN